MKTIPSFTIDHIRLLRGIYVSRKDQLGDEVVVKIARADLDKKQLDFALVEKK